jgi:hypothetical protein
LQRASVVAQTPFQQALEYMKMKYSMRITSLLVLSASSMLALPGCMADMADVEDEGAKETTQLRQVSPEDAAKAEEQGSMVEEKAIGEEEKAIGGEKTAKGSQELNWVPGYGYRYMPGWPYGWYGGYGAFRPGFGYYHPGFGYLPPAYYGLPPGYGYFRPGYGYFRPGFGYFRPGFGWGYGPNWGWGW